ncbi:DoxX family protein [Nitrospirillum viridazoti]|uniref:DoxX family protein n=2 Tax=Nitrospirillum TaxID=1543705 RepID=A0A248JYM4_9PROT|nr:DoxX family protein [Nitrospirillum amazonense]ASG23802.1 DoxX family protein [Nitrospirillum amazonense CBAmc]EGY01254.1 DoxX family protein [Nitrospirillum amazonense Y2]TWB44783.1 putative oxidoreductase [Nitrospirillum amazonense]TWB47331.1 putative oxidoreductase [Nitrospirillum amazonense]
MTLPLTPTTAPGKPAPIALALALVHRLERFPRGLDALLWRLAAATVFWRSGQTKVTGFHINDTTFDLFRDEYKVPLIPPEVAAVLASITENLCAVLLVVGLASRLSAGALFGMTLVIEIFVYPESWPDHLLWSAVLVPIILRGPGVLSLDHLVRRRLDPAASHNL